jgi:putative hydrolase of the HAD superfamily
MVLLLDAANTIIYKPRFYINFIKVLDQYGITISMQDLQMHHKVISECYHFPDKTSREFYMKFNGEVLYSLGIIPTEQMLQSIFSACSYIEWEKFEDTKYLSSLSCTKSILSNFHGGLNLILDKLFLNEFKVVTISENEKVRKPDKVFFEIAIKNLAVDPAEIIYIGDSIKLDLEPGLNAGMNAWLIDRNNNYPYCKRRLQSLKEIKNLL